jgi:hypothetical protein
VKTLIVIILIAGISYVAYYFIREAALKRQAQRDNALHIVEISELPSDYIDESIPASSKPAFDPLLDISADNKYERPAENLRKERDFLDNPVDEKNREEPGNPYTV